MLLCVRCGGNEVSSDRWEASRGYGGSTVERSLQWRIRLEEVVSDRCRWNVDVLDWPKSRSVVEGVR